MISKNLLKAMLLFASLGTAGGILVLFLDFTDSKRTPVILQECFIKANEYEQWLCLEPYFKDLASKVSVNYAMSELQSLRDQELVDNCHFIAHYIGEANLEEQNFNVGKAFATCEFGCAEGCFHGVMEGYIRRESDPYAVLSKLGMLCDTIPVKLPSVPGTRIEDEEDLRIQCAHGVGHGLAAHGFLPVLDASEACQGFNNEDYKIKCENGVIMEHVEQYLILKEDKLKEFLPKICAPFKDLKREGADMFEKCQSRALKWSAALWDNE